MSNIRFHETERYSHAQRNPWIDYWESSSKMLPFGILRSMTGDKDLLGSQVGEVIFFFLPE